MRLTVKEIARITNGSITGDPLIEVEGISTDSRTLLPRELFVPIISKRNGHEFISNAVAQGASAHLYSQGNPYGNAIKVNDTLTALHSLARFSRSKIPGDVVAITGSVGKTTTKDMLFSCIRELDNIHVSKLSYNNEIGLPLTIISADETTKHLVLEMGARGPGQIAELCNLATPNIGIVTRVNAAHTEFFQDEEEIAETKGALIESLPITGTAILNNDDDRVRKMASRTKANIITFGFKDAVIIATDVFIDENLNTRFRINSPWGTQEISLNVPGVHNVSNAMAAIGGGLSMGYRLEDICDPLSRVKLSPMRMDSRYLIDGTLILNDSYNANPTSMNAAIDTIMTSNRPNKIAVVGTMAELGEISQEEHEAIGDRLTKSGISWVSVGEKKYGGASVETWRDALSFIRNQDLIGEDVVILIKGSRVAGLDQLADALK